MKQQPSEATKLKIVEFFMRTSIPRILEKEKLKEEQNQVAERRLVNDGEKRNT